MKVAKVFIKGFIDENSVKTLNLQLEKAGDYTEIEVYIDSYGGYVGEGKSLLSTLLLEQAKGIIINTFGMGQVCSAATFPFMVGTKRTLHPFTDFLAHPPFGSFEGDVRDLEKYAKELKDIEDFIIDLYQKTTLKSYDDIKNLMIKNTIITAKEAVEFGFATDIYEFENINVKNSYQKNKPISLIFNMNKKVLEISAFQKFALNLGATTKAKIFISNAKKHITKNMIIATDAGVSLYVYSDDMNLIDKVVVIADEAGNPTEEAAPNGKHKVTADGKLYEIEVLDGVITSAVEEVSDAAETAEMKKEEAPAENKELMDTLDLITNSIKKLTEKMDALETFKSKLENVRPQTAQNTAQNTAIEGFPLPEHLKNL